MSKIKIKHFGPIKEGFIENEGFIDIKKVTAFIGGQGSGKSTVAKLISTFTWLEKALNRGDIALSNLHFARLYEMFDYHNINEYNKKDTYIEYAGDKYSIIYDKQKKGPEVGTAMNGSYSVPQIMYVPAERNLLTVIEHANDVKRLPAALVTFAQEYKNAQTEFGREGVLLPIDNIQYYYEETIDGSFIKSHDLDYDINLSKASSGYQSLVPLYIVSRYITDQLAKEASDPRDKLTVNQIYRFTNEIADLTFGQNMTNEDRDRMIKEVAAKYLNTAFINIVEEPEQNLFPSSQRKMLNSLLEFNNFKSHNKLIITTHSPYLINYLTLAVEADKLKQQVNTDVLKNRLCKIVPLHSTINADDLVIYELNEQDGTIRKLGTYDGLPSDENYLNESLGESNELFSQLLEIQQQL